MTKPCVITIWKHNSKPPDIRTGDLTWTEILDVLKTIMSGMSREMYAEAIKACGTNNPEVLAEYLDEQLRLERLSGNDLIND